MYVMLFERWIAPTSLFVLHYRLFQVEQSLRCSVPAASTYPSATNGFSSSRAMPYVNVGSLQGLSDIYLFFYFCKCRTLALDRFIKVNFYLLSVFKILILNIQICRQFISHILIWVLSRCPIRTRFSISIRYKRAPWIRHIDGWLPMHLIRHPWCRLHHGH